MDEIGDCVNVAEDGREPSSSREFTVSCVIVGEGEMTGPSRAGSASDEGMGGGGICSSSLESGAEEGSSCLRLEAGNSDAGCVDDSSFSSSIRGTPGLLWPELRLDAHGEALNLSNEAFNSPSFRRVEAVDVDATSSRVPSLSLSES